MLRGRKTHKSLSKVAACIKDMGITPDKPFIPHVTLFRIKNRRLRMFNMLTKYNDLKFGSDFIDRIHLKSQLTKTGLSIQIYLQCTEDDHYNTLCYFSGIKIFATVGERK